MLKASEIEKLIKQHKPLPPKSDYFEKFYYFALDVCVERFRQNKLSKEDLKEYQLGYREIEKALGHAELCIDGCEKCRQIARLIDGREDYG